jgi:hypothetical protein
MGVCDACEREGSIVIDGVTFCEECAELIMGWTPAEDDLPPVEVLSEEELRNEW